MSLRLLALQHFVNYGCDTICLLYIFELATLWLIKMHIYSTWILQQVFASLAGEYAVMRIQMCPGCDQQSHNEQLSITYFTRATVSSGFKAHGCQCWTQYFRGSRFR
jgi:hypothetical protein